MLEASIDGLRYHRLLAETVLPDDTARLKRDYDYSFLVSYGTFDDHEYEIADKNSCLIDISLDIEKIFSAFSATCRNEIRRAEKNPDLSFHHEAQDFDSFYSFHSECEKERGWYPLPKEELKNSLLFYVSCKRIPISGMSCYATHDRLRVGRIFSRRRAGQFEDIPRVVFSGTARRIVYELCKFGKAQGFRTLDLGGVDINDSTKAGISNFKMSFGGTVTPVKIGRYMSPEFKQKLPTMRAMGLDIT